MVQVSLQAIALSNQILSSATGTFHRSLYDYTNARKKRRNVAFPLATRHRMLVLGSDAQSHDISFSATLRKYRLTRYAHIV
jgi:hypothetical protein